MGRKAGQEDKYQFVYGWVLLAIFVGLVPLIRSDTLCNAGRTLMMPMSRTVGVVVSASEKVKSSRSRSYEPDITYSYQVDGVSYVSNTISHGPFSGGPKSFSEPIMRRFPKGQRVYVYYDPRDPAFAVLDKRASWHSVFLFGLMLVAGAGCGIVAGKKCCF